MNICTNESSLKNKKSLIFLYFITKTKYNKNRASHRTNIEIQAKQQFKIQDKRNSLHQNLS